MKKNERIKSIDFSLTILNFIVMVFIAILVFVNTALITLSFISTIVLCGLTLVSFSQKNPYYILSCYGMATCGLIFSIGLLLMPEWPFHPNFSILFIVAFILDVYFIASLTKVSESSWSGMSSWINIGNVIEPNTSISTYIKNRYEPLGDDKISKSDKLELKKAIRKKYHVWWILLITLISTFMFFSTTILSFL